MGLSFPATWRCAFLILTTVPLSNCRAIPPYTFDSAPSGEHAVSHAPDTCIVCDLYYDAQASVVRIRSTKTQGAGVVVSTSGQILTNAHVVHENDRPQIETRNGDIFDAKVVRKDRSLDLALLQAEGDVITWIPLQMKPTGMPRVGSEVYVVGHPVGLGWTVSRGIVSATRKPGEVWRTAIIQTDAAISPGNSGGPLLDRHGNLIGLVVLKVSGAGAENVAFAIPASVVLAFLNDSESTSSPSPDARAPRPRQDAARGAWQMKSVPRRGSHSWSSTVLAEPQAQIPNQSAEDLYRLGKEALSAGEYKKSIRFLEQAAVQAVGRLGQSLIEQPADDLAILEHERHVVRADLEHRPRARAAGVGVAKSGIEKSGVMDAEFTDQGVVGTHLGGVMWRHRDGVARLQDVKIARVQYQVAFA